jgi:site-specific DNA-cytosine methylase
MGYTDEDYEKAAAVNSNTQLYKQAGNAIIRQVLMALFLQMGIQGKKRWNEMTDKERYEIWQKTEK